LNLDGNYDCGLKKAIEGCYCLDGFVLNGAGNCISNKNCGCSLPDNSAVLSVINFFLMKPFSKYLYSCLVIN
jgi:hypothetical protein